MALQGILARTPEAPITIYHIGEKDSPQHWWDLCAGPHVARTGDISPEAFDLETVTGERRRRMNMTADWFHGSKHACVCTGT